MATGYETTTYTTPFGVIEMYEDPPGVYCAHYKDDYDLFEISDLDRQDAAIKLLDRSVGMYFETGHTRPTKRG